MKTICLLFGLFLFFLACSESSPVLSSEDRAVLKARPLDLGEKDLEREEAGLVDVSGTYVSGDKAGGAYYDEMVVRSLGQGRYALKLSSGGAGKGCRFEAEASLEAGSMLIDLNTIDKQLKAKMLIEFREGELSISTEDFEQRFDLMYFCGGGGSLMGDYRKMD